MKMNAERYGLDSNRVAVSGSSSGAQVASLVGLSDLPIHEGESKLSASSKIQAIINIDGILAFHHPESAEGKVAAEWLGGYYEEIPEIWDEASPAYLAAPHLVPMLFINSQYPRFHAGRDELVKKLGDAGLKYQIHTFPDSPHPFWLYEPWFEPTSQLIAEFLGEVF